MGEYEGDIISLIFQKKKLPSILGKDELSKTKRGIFNEPRGVAIYLTRMIRSDGLMDICKDYNLAKYSSASSIVETVRKKLQKNRKFLNSVNALS